MRKAGKKEKLNWLPSLSDWVRALRGDMSQAKFAEFLGMSRTSVCLYESGTRIPDALGVRTIAEKCHVSADLLLGMPGNDHSDEETLKEAIAVYGAIPQINMVMEEMAELQKELCKNLRGRDNVEQIAEEIADVGIMLDQMIVLFDCAAAVHRVRTVKVVRLKERLQAAKEGGTV